MTLLTRLTRLFRADMHAMLDSLEEPTALLKQAVREMEDILATEEQQLRVLQQEQVELAAHATEDAALEQQLAQELAVCFDAGADDLARNLVRRKLEAEQRQILRTRRAQALQRAQTTVQARAASHRQRLEELRQQAALALVTPCAGTPAQCHRDEASGAPPISEAAVEVAFLRANQQRSVA